MPLPSLRPFPVRLAALLALLAGCEATCENTCEKLLACEAVDTPLVAEIDCERSCLTQEALYEDWDDQLKRDALGDYKNCVADSPCADIAEGVCYDEDIYIW